MFQKLPWRIQTLIESIFPKIRWRNFAKYKPDFSDLPTDSSACKETQHKSRISTNAVLDYFLTRERPKFFFNWQQARFLLRSKEFIGPGLKRLVISKAEFCCSEFLSVYSKNINPINADFEWLSLEKFCSNDVLYLAKPHRFGFAPLLSLAALYGSNTIENLDVVIVNWMKYAQRTTYDWPYLSNLVVIYRILALSWSWNILAALDEKPNTYSSRIILNILRIIREDIRFLGPRLGNSHKNNHLLADYFIGWFINIYYSEYSGNYDFSQYEGMFLKELRRQFYSDGGSFEHSIHYHELGCEMAITYLIVKRVNDMPIELSSESLIGKMLAFQSTLAGTENRSWLLGDTTEDPLIPLDLGNNCTTIALKEIFRKYFNPGFPGQHSDKISSHKAFWLLGGDMTKSIVSRKTKERLVVNYFPKAGFHHCVDSALQSTFLFRIGVTPDIEYMPGHMHSDLLSVYWRIQGKDILMPSGTYSYKFDTKAEINFREYLCSSRSHCGFFIEGEDPLGYLNGSFRNIDNGCRVEAKAIGDGVVLSACEGRVLCDNPYNGYRRGIIHIPGYFSVIYDVVPEHAKGLNKGFGWQFSPNSQVQISSDNRVIIINDGNKVFLIPALNLGCGQKKVGSKMPLTGWISESYGKITPSPNIYFPFTHQAGLTGFLMTQKVDQGGLSMDTLSDENGNILITIKDDECTHDIIVCNKYNKFIGAANLPKFIGEILHIFKKSGIPVSVRAIGAVSLEWEEYGLKLVEETGVRNLILYMRHRTFDTVYSSKNN